MVKTFIRAAGLLVIQEMGGDSGALMALRRLKEQSLDRSLSIEETQSLGPAVADHILPITDIPTRVMIVDNCGERADWKPQLVKEEFKKHYRLAGDSGAYIFDLDDIPGGDDVWITREIKFRLLAGVATAIVVFVEPHRNEPSLTELSVLSEPQYREKSIVLEETPPGENHSSPVPELAEELDPQGRYFTVPSIADLTKTCDTIFEETSLLQDEPS